MRYFFADGSHERFRNGEGGGDPAVGVDHVDGHVVVVDALDRITDVLRRRDEQREGDQHDRREDVVQPEDDIVRHNLLTPEVFLQSR